MTAPQAEAVRKAASLVPSHEQQDAFAQLRGFQAKEAAPVASYTVGNSWNANTTNYTPATAFNAATLTTSGQ